MKKITTLTVLLLFAITIFNSCSKFEEGPGLSLKSKKARLTNSWEIENISDSEGNKVDFTEIFNIDSIINVYDFEIVFTSQTLTFVDDESFEFTIGYSIMGWPSSFTSNGTWAFINETGLKTEVSASEEMGIPASIDEYNILRLTSNELWLEYTNPIGSETYEIHLISAE